MTYVKIYLIHQIPEQMYKIMFMLKMLNYSEYIKYLVNYRTYAGN